MIVDYSINNIPQGKLHTGDYLNFLKKDDVVTFIEGNIVLGEYICKETGIYRAYFYMNHGKFKLTLTRPIGL